MGGIRSLVLMFDVFFAYVLASVGLVIAQFVGCLLVRCVFNCVFLVGLSFFRSCFDVQQGYGTFRPKMRFFTDVFLEAVKFTLVKCVCLGRWLLVFLSVQGLLLHLPSLFI